MPSRQKGDSSPRTVAVRFQQLVPISVLGNANSSLLGGLFMVDISICLIFVAMILTPFIVDSLHGPFPARAITETVPKNAVRSCVRQAS
jgi:hypothetical protein